jgi:subtilisin-like proprotein convertase family protein
MRRAVYSAAVLSLAFEAGAAVVRTEDRLHITVEGVEVSPSREAGYQQARLVGVDELQALSTEVGAPELPVLRFYVDGDVEIRARGEVREAKLEGNLPLVPVQPSRVKTPGATPALVKDPAVYARSGFGEGALYTVDDAGSVRGVRRRLVTLRPLSYAPASGEYRLVTQFDVEILSHDRGDRTSQEVFAFVVGARFKASPALARYAALKEALGYRVEYVEVTGGDTPETIRARLKRLYAGQDGERLTQVLIVGDAGDVPAKTAAHITGVTDHYYRAIDTDNYDADINGPDVGVGRLAVASEAQLEVVLDKLTRYHDGAFADEGWLKDVAWLATDDRYEIAEGSHNYVIDTYARQRGYRGVFPSDPQQGGDQLYAVTHRVSNAKVHEAMGLGRTIINYSGHGSTTSWAGPSVSQADVRRLADPNALPFVISNACITGDFRVGESFAETWQRHRAGAIAFWGSMDSSYWDEDDILERRLFDGIFRDGQLQFGQITSFALSEHWRHYQGGGKSKYYWETYVLFGDPSLDLRTTRSHQVRLDGPEALPVGSSAATYTVVDTESGRPVAGARVALSVEGGAFKATGISDAAGVVRFDLEAAARDVVDLKITASGANLRATQKELRIVPADFAYLSLGAFRANGREDGVVYAGESVELAMAITNIGQRPTQGGTLRIARVEGPATATAQVATLPALAARDAYRLPGGLALVLAETAQDDDLVRVELAWETKEGQSGTAAVSLRVSRAQLSVQSVDFGEPGPSGGLRPGETGALYLTVKNEGGEALTQASVTVAAGACIADADGALALPALAPGAVARIETPVTVTIDAACRNGDAAVVEVAGTYRSHARDLPIASTARFVAGVLVTSEIEQPGLSKPIRDNATVEQAIDVTPRGALEAVGIHVRLRHTYIGDLKVSLVHPDGTEVLLHDRAGGGADDLDLELGLGGQAHAQLEALKGKEVAGRWKLVVRDEASSDVGTLDYVELRLRGYLD